MAMRRQSVSLPNVLANGTPREWLRRTTWMRARWPPGLDSRSLSVLGLGRGAFSLGKRFRSSSETDVSLLIFVDPDAYSARPAWLFSGGRVNFQCSSPNGQISNLKLGGERDQAGGVGLFEVISLSPGK
jgi:hypothetical protein